MTFPVNPFVGERFTAGNGQEFMWTDKGTWLSVEASGNRFRQINYTASANAPLNPHYGDQWFDTTEKQLKTWAYNGDFGFWRTVAVGSATEDPSQITLIAERTVPLMWNYGEENYTFEAWSTEAQYSWRDTVPARIRRITAQDDTIELDTTSGIQAGKRYVVTTASGTTQAVVDILAVLSPTVARARTTFSINVGESDGATLSRTSFDVRAGYAVVQDNDVLFTRPLNALQTNFQGRLRLRRSAEGRGTFVIGVRTPGTDIFEPVSILETVTPATGFRDEVYAVEKTGPVEFSIRFLDPSNTGDRVEHIMLHPAPQDVDARRVERPTNFAPADQEINISVTPTLQGSAFRSLYNLPQNGAEFQIATNQLFTNLVVNSSSDFLASWVASAGIASFVRSLDYATNATVYYVGSSGYAQRSTDGGATRSPLTLVGNPTTHLNSVACNEGTVVIVGASALIQTSTDGGATFAAITAAGGYTDDFQAVAVADRYAVIVGNAGEIQRTVNNQGGVYAKAQPDNNYIGTWYDVALLTNGRGIAVGTSGEIQTTVDFGATWRKRTPAGGFTSSFMGVALTPDGHAIAVGSGGEIQTSDDYGATWVRRTASNAYNATFNAVALNGVYAVAVGVNGEIQTSSNYGATWSRRTTPGSAATAELSAVRFALDGSTALLAGNAVQYRPLKLEGAVTSYTVPSGSNLLDVDKVYWWRVRYQDSAGFWSEYSKPTVFATKGTLDAVNAPTNLSPAKEATNISTTPTLQASAFSVIGAPDTHNGSQWQISAGAVFGTPLYDSGTVAAGTSLVVPVGSALVDKQTYSWRVRYRGATNGWGSWSLATSFTVAAKPLQPTISTVVENTTTAANRFALIHTAFTSPIAGDTYSQLKYEIATAADFGTASLVRQTTVAASGTTLNIPATAASADTVKGSFERDTTYFFRIAVKGSQSNFSDWSPTFTLRTAKPPVVGEAVYTTPGTHTFTVPEGITSVCAVVVGGGSGGVGSGTSNSALVAGGGGGGLTWKNNIPVTPGQQITVTVGRGGPGAMTEDSSGINRGDYNGGSSSFGSTISAGGGVPYYGGTGGRGGTALGGDGGGDGGVGQFGGGGGAGGYTGSGGQGGSGTGSGAAQNGSGGGGGGGGVGAFNNPSGGSGAGGGVGLYGQGPDGVAGQPITAIGGGNHIPATGGSGGSSGTAGGNGSGGTGGTGGRYGGGAGGGTVYGGGGAGGVGAVRVMWGPGRSFPNNAA